MTLSLTTTTPSTNGMLAEWISFETNKKAAVDDAVSAAIGHKVGSNRLPKEVTTIVVDYLKEFIQCFGEREWTTLCGKVAPAPALPANFLSIWHSPCPIYPQKKISQTHKLVYIPTTVDEKPLTIKKLGEIAKRYFPKNAEGYHYILRSFVKEFGDKPIDKACWVLMTEDVLPNSRGESYEVQGKMVADLATKTLASYEVPQTLEAAVCILAYFFSSKIRLYSDDPMTFTRCQENVGGYQMVVGGFAPAGLGVWTPRYDYDDIGVAALRKF